LLTALHKLLFVRDLKLKLCHLLQTLLHLLAVSLPGLLLQSQLLVESLDCGLTCPLPLLQLSHQVRVPASKAKKHSAALHTGGEELHRLGAF